MFSVFIHSHNSSRVHRKYGIPNIIGYVKAFVFFWSTIFVGSGRTEPPAIHATVGLWSNTRVLHRVALAGFDGVGLAFTGVVNAYRIAVYFAAVRGVVGVGDGSVAAVVAQDAADVLAALP